MVGSFRIIRRGAGKLLALMDETANIEDGFELEYSDGDIKIYTDPIQRVGVDSVMPILVEEQVATWNLLGDSIVRSMDRGLGKFRFLDVGTGSGYFALKAAKQFARRTKALLGLSDVVAVDRCPRMVVCADRNARTNGVDLTVLSEEYTRAALPARSVSAIFMNPPYHIYPPTLEPVLRLHAAGGPNGFELFLHWLDIALGHLADGGSIYFHMMCLGKDHPAYVDHLLAPSDRSQPLPSITYSNLLEPISSSLFLDRVYSGTPWHDHPFLHEVSLEYPTLYYTSGYIVPDSRGLVRAETQSVAPRTWDDRIKLHRYMVETASKALRSL